MNQQKVHRHPIKCRLAFILFLTDLEEEMKHVKTILRHPRIWMGRERETLPVCQAQGMSGSAARSVHRAVIQHLGTILMLAGQQQSPGYWCHRAPCWYLDQAARSL